MGEFPARIVAEDFVTPSEFSPWQLALNGAGRIGGVRLTLAARAGGTHLASYYEQIPMRVLPLNLGPGEPLLVYLLNPTAGLMDGDAHRVEIHARAGTRTVVTGQSATRIHPGLNGFCTQQWKVRVDDGAILVVLPGPAIPFQGCRYFQRAQIDLAESAQLIWGDLWFAGRYARQKESEAFRFDRIVQEMVVHRQGRLVYRDRFCWQGPWDHETARWHFGGFPAVGTLFAAGAVAEESLAHLSKTSNAMFTTAAGDTCSRFAGSSEAVIRGVAENSLRLAAVMASAAAENSWLLSGHHLARTHWFDVR